jgi:omega-amidase
MRITIVQPDILWENIPANLEHFDRLLDFSPGFTDLIVLPEMFTTGFSLNALELAEKPSSETFAWMKRLSVVKNAAVCGSYIISEDGHFFNRFIFTSPEGEIYYYNKRHLFSISGEDKNYTRGSERLIFNYFGFRIMPVICYDLRFPVWMRNRDDYDLILCIANWPESRREAWNTLLKARAIENQCFVAGVNRIGNDQAGNKYAGESIILDARGNTIAVLRSYSEGHATADISLSSLQNFRNEFPAWRDADDFNLSL